MAGSTLSEIAQVFELTKQGVAYAVEREGRRTVTDLELTLWRNVATGDVEWFLIPDHSGTELDLALSFFRWLVIALERDGVPTVIHFEPADGGMLLGLTQDVSALAPNVPQEARNA